MWQATNTVGSGKGNDQGKVERLVGYSRRNVMLPIPRFADWNAFTVYLEGQCRSRQGDIGPVALWCSLRRKQYGGTGTGQRKERKRLRKENERLRRAVSDLTLDKLNLSEAKRRNF